MISLLTKDKKNELLFSLFGDLVSCRVTSFVIERFNYFKVGFYFLNC